MAVTVIRSSSLGWELNLLPLFHKRGKQTYFWSQLVALQGNCVTAQTAVAEARAAVRQRDGDNS